MKYLKKHWSNILFGLFITLMILPQTRMPIQVLLNKGLALFSPSVINSEDRNLIENYNWQLVDLEGNTFNYASTQNKVVLINFWATWCPPCVAEMPSLEKLYSDYKDKIIFLFVSNEDNEKVSTFITKNDYTFNVYKPLTQYPKVFNVSTIPRTFLIDKKGNIVIDKTGASNWNSNKVRAVIDQLISEY
ncbi:MAG: TlpA family protein disulfide reductase [Flavobacteriaceae bacterium]|nr:TlpA family protein disulfide reductase [Flavobacteriaceae bacterium]